MGEAATAAPNIVTGAPPTVGDYLANRLYGGRDHWDWQRSALLRSAAAPAFAFMSEPRCGKSKPTLDTAAWRFLQGPGSPLYVDLALIVAMPSNVPSNWVEVEVPQQVGPAVPVVAVAWDADVFGSPDEGGTKAGREWMHAFFRRTGRLRVLAVNGESVTSEKLLAWLRLYFPACRVAVFVDESTLVIKTAGIRREEKLYAIGRQRTVVCRRILDGTPAGESPMDMYAQFGFLDRAILGFDTFAAFKAHHSVMERHGDAANWAAYKAQLKVAEKRGLRDGAAVAFADRAARRAGTGWWTQARDGENRVIYRHLDQIAERIAPHSVRVRRRDVFGGPQPVFQKHFFEMTRAQLAVYEQLRDEYEAELGNGERVEARHVLTRWMRLQQVSRNYWPSARTTLECTACDGEDDACPSCGGAGFVEGPREPARAIDPKRNPALETLMGQLRAGDQTTVWCRFHHEVDEVMAACRAAGFAPAQYDGRLSGPQKHAGAEAYRARRANPIVGTPRSGGRGVALPSKDLFYYCHEYSLLGRLQSQDRAEAAGNLEGTGINDLLCLGTKDFDVVDALVHKRKVSDVVMRESSGRWL